MSNSDAQKKLREAGVVDVILKVLDIHIEDADSSKSAIVAIGALAKDDINRELLIEAGVIEKVIATLNKYIENNEIVNACVDTLNALNVELVADDESNE